jgi:alginate O-acetyltransferase complex protein AlgJ
VPSSRSRLVFAVLAIAFFATPLALRAVGVTARPFENRVLAGPPRLSQGWNAFDEASRFFVDRMPLREQAVRANTWISRHIFDTTPRYGQGAFAAAAQSGLPFGQPLAPQPAPAQRPRPNQPAPAGNHAVVGRDGWLYLQGELDRACSPPITYAQAVSDWKQVLALVRASGRRAVVLVVPDKSTIYPEHLPESFQDKQCSEHNRQTLWAAIDAASPGNVVGLRSPLLAAKRRAGDGLYRRKDSHWSTLGSLALVQAALERIGGGVRLRPSEIVDPGPGTYTGDLTTLVGAAEQDRVQQRNVQRARGARRVPGRTLFVYDSYGQIGLAQVAPYFVNFRSVDWSQTVPTRRAEEVARSDTVIFETVEREFDYRASDLGEAGPALLAALRRRLGR